MPAITEHTGELAEQPTFWLAAGETTAPVVYVHGVPTSSEDWRPFLERTGGLAPDLPGFGRAGKRADLPFTMAWYADWLGHFLDDRGVDRFSLVVHDWGAVGLVTAQRLADRVDRVVVLNAVPLLPGFCWHRVARLWRRRSVGELVMGATTGRALRRSLPAGVADHAVPFFDLGTQRAILRLYRSAPEAALADAGADLGRLTAPALVVWGDRDPYVPASFAEAYGAALGGTAEVVHLDDAGHWPWLERPDVVDRVARFLGA